MRVRHLLLLFAALLLAGCESQTLKGSVAGGECRIFERPSYVVRGLRRYDQDWIDSQVEGGVGGCHWQRPAPRPPELDAPAAAAAQPAPRPKKRGMIARIKAAVHRAPTAPPVAPEPAPAVAAPADEPERPTIKVPQVAPPAPRTRLELLLDPSGPAVSGAK